MERPQKESFGCSGKWLGNAEMPNKLEMSGEACRDRTYDPQIKSLLLYQLS